MEDLDVEKLTSLEEVNEQVTKHKDLLHTRVKNQKKLEQDLKDLKDSYKEPISEAKAEVKIVLERLDELNKRRLELEANKVMQ